MSDASHTVTTYHARTGEPLTCPACHGETTRLIAGPESSRPVCAACYVLAATPGHTLNIAENQEER